jgi:hypothetical protein
MAAFGAGEDGACPASREPRRGEPALQARDTTR